MYGEPEQYAYQAAIICPKCAEKVMWGQPRKADTGDSDDYPQPDCSGESPRSGETCDICEDVYIDGEWRGYVPEDIRWARCRACNSQYAYARGTEQYEVVRHDALSGVLKCSNCLKPAVHF
jgi:hypothetical protein